MTMFFEFAKQYQFILYIWLWLSAGFVAAGFCTAYFTRKWVGLAVREGSMGDPLQFLLFLMGPFGFFFALVEMEGVRKYGWKMPLTGPTLDDWEKYADDFDRSYYAEYAPKE